jgi:hypothetical protein
MDYHPVSRVDFHELQHQDPLLSSWFKHVLEGKKPKVDSLSTGFERKTLCKNFKNLRIADDFIV